MFFLDKKNRFLDKKKHFSAKRKNGRFFVIPAGTRSVVIVGHFFMAPRVPPSFVDHGPKLRVLIIAKLQKPEMAINHDELQKMIHSLETKKNRGGPNGKVVALGALVKCPFKTKS